MLIVGPKEASALAVQVAGLIGFVVDIFSSGMAFCLAKPFPLWRCLPAMQRRRYHPAQPDHRLTRGFTALRCPMTPSPQNGVAIYRLSAFQPLPAESRRPHVGISGKLPRRNSRAPDQADQRPADLFRTSIVPPPVATRAPTWQGRPAPWCPGAIGRYSETQARRVSAAIPKNTPRSSDAGVLPERRSSTPRTLRRMADYWDLPAFIEPGRKAKVFPADYLNDKRTAERSRSGSGSACHRI